MRGRRRFLGRLISVGAVAVPSWLTLPPDARAADAEADPWMPVRQFVGDWSGTSSGMAGNGTVQRQYAFVLNGKFLRETNISVYPPQEKNPRGETHEHLALFSYDKQRKLLVLRQFHTEGFVNSFRRTVESGPLVFESESFENFSNQWKARESYEFASADEFVEAFDLAAPGKAFSTYSRTHLKRVGK